VPATRPFPYRYIYLGLGLVAVAAIALGIAFGRGPEPTPLPAGLQEVFPAPGDSAVRPVVLEVDLDSGLKATIVVDGFAIPEQEVSFVEATGVHRWTPSPTSLVMTEWTPGDHTVRITWDSLAGMPAPGEFEWTFRIQ
jgi:hypothetical protein